MMVEPKEVLHCNDEVVAICGVCSVERGSRQTRCNLDIATTASFPIR